MDRVRSQYGVVPVVPASSPRKWGPSVVLTKTLDSRFRGNDDRNYLS